jgi:hypothetical protein
MARKKQPAKPQSAKEISESIFSSPADVADIDSSADATAKQYRQRPQEKPKYVVSDLARDLRSKIKLQSAMEPKTTNPRDIPYRVAGEQVGETGALVRSRVTTPRKEVVRARQINKAKLILEGKLVFTPRPTRSLTSGGIVPSEAYLKTSEQPVKKGYVNINGTKHWMPSLEDTRDILGRSISDEYFANTPKEAVDSNGKIKNSHLESELYRLNAHMAKNYIDTVKGSRSPANTGVDSPELEAERKAYNEKYELPASSPVKSLFQHRDYLVGRIVGNSATENLTAREGAQWPPVARVNDQGIFGLIEAPREENITDRPLRTTRPPLTDAQREKDVRAAGYTQTPQKDSLPDRHKLELRDGNLWIRRTFNGVHVPHFDELVQRGTDRIPEGGKTISISDFSAHRYAPSADGAESFANVGGAEHLVHASTVHHYIVSKDDAGQLTVAPHPTMEPSSGGLFAVHPANGKPVEVSPSSVMPSSEVRENVARGMVTQGAGARWEQASSGRPEPEAPAGPSERDLIHNLWVKHGPQKAAPGMAPIPITNASHQVKQNWFNNAHSIAVEHFTKNNPGAEVPSDKFGLVDNFFSKERKKAAYKRDAQKASDLGLM